MNNKGFSGVMSLLITIIIVAVLVIVGLAWLNNNDDSVDETLNDAQDGASQVIDETSESLDNADDNLLSQIVDNPENYYGQTVTVSGEIQDVYSGRVFKISDQTVGDELMVISRQALTAEQSAEAEEFFEDNADVTATGEIRQMTIAEIETEFSVDIPEELEVEFADKPLLVADSFTFSDGNAVLDFTQGPETTN